MGSREESVGGTDERPRPRPAGARPALIVVAIALFIAIVAAIVLLWPRGQEVYQLASAEEAFVTSKYDERLFALDREAVDNGYREQIEHLIATWFKDDTDQPRRALNGARTARKRYIDMMTAIEKRENEVKTLKGLQQR